jgi:hypothetical protein
LGESINLIVVATGKREQLSDEFFQPSGAPGKTDRSSGLNGAVRASSAGRYAILPVLRKCPLIKFGGFLVAVTGTATCASPPIHINTCA